MLQCVYIWVCEFIVHVYECMYICMHTCVYGHACVHMYMYLWPEADSFAVSAGLTCGLLQGDKWGKSKAVCFSACIFPFFVFIKHWLLILEVEHCHKKPFAVNKAVSAAWGVNGRPGKSCENHLSAMFTKWVRRKGKMGHPGSSILVPHTGRGSPFHAGIEVIRGCAQVLGRRPTLCTAVREQASLPAAVKTLVRPPGRPGCLSQDLRTVVPGSGLTADGEVLSVMAPPHPG